MLKRTFKRIRRTGKVPAEVAQRDRELRSAIRAEFPPLEGGPISSILSEPLREAIARSRKSVRRLAKEASVSAIVLQQFVDGQRDLRLVTAERLAWVLKLKLVAV